MRFLMLIVILLTVFLSNNNAQIIINELSSRNASIISDEDGDFEDWIELYNPTNEFINLRGWSLTENQSKSNKWIFSNRIISPKGFLLVFASGKNRNPFVLSDHWETAVFPTDSFSYKIPASSIPGWSSTDFNDLGWAKGIGGFGYSDNDDNTILPNGTISVYIRREFTISDKDDIVQAICHVDYDDGFVAYINGVEISRANVTGTPGYNTVATQNHSPMSETGEIIPSAFSIDSLLLKSVLKDGKNVFAVEGHNVSASSSDMTLIPYLSFGIKNSIKQFQKSPDWLTFTASNLHTNFKLSPDEFLFLNNPEKQIVDMIDVDVVYTDFSKGRETDGADGWAYFQKPTPGKTNNSSFAFNKGVANKPILNPSAGYYSGGIQVSLSGSDSILYTTDGSEPTSQSALYKNIPITINTTTVVKARSFSNSGQLPSRSSVSTFFINENNTLPVLSVSTNSENLFGTNGIFTNFNSLWNKPCYVEYYDANKELVFSEYAGIQVDGGAGGSRSKPQTSFRIEPGNGAYGDGDVKYRLIPDRPKRDNYSSFYMRNGSGQYLALPYKAASLEKLLGKNNYNYYSAYTPSVVYINGSYYGVYETREKINEDFIESNYGISIDSLDLIGVSHFKGVRTLLPIRGSIDGFNKDYATFKTLSPTSANYLEQVATFLDLENYTDYMIAELWSGNRDWPQNNIKIFRSKGTNYKWRFALSDFDSALTGVSGNLTNKAEDDPFTYLFTKVTDFPYTTFWYYLMQNNIYKARFINRFADMINTNYGVDSILNIEQTIYNEVFPSMERHFSRWGTSTSNLADFTKNHLKFKSELQKRSTYVRLAIQNKYALSKQVTVELNVQPSDAGFVQVSTVKPQLYPWTGIYFTNNPVTIKAIPKPGYVFSKWISNVNIANESSVETTFDSDFVSYLAVFKKGENLFRGLTISEINYKDGADLNTTDWFEIFNSTESVIDLSDWSFTDDDPQHVFTFPQNVLIQPFGRLVVTKNLSKFKILYPNISNVIGDFNFSLGTPQEELHLYNYHREQICEARFADFFPWALHSDESGKTLELIDPGHSLNDPLNWFAGCIGGSPGMPYSDCNALPTSTLSTPANNEFLSSFRISPIPAQTYIDVQFILGQVTSDVKIQLSDLTGTLVFEQCFENLQSGLNILHLNIAELNRKGVLLLTLVTNDIRKTQKIILN